MGVMSEGLSPGVKDTKEADLRSEMFRVGSNVLQRFRRGLKQETVEKPFVLEGNRRQGFRQRKDDVKILAGQQFCLTFFQPLGARQRLAFRAMPIAARVISIPFLPALVAPLKMAAESSGATGFESMQYTLLRGGQRGSVLLAKLLAMSAHNVANFEGRPHERTRAA
jgi:hypothetical protein